MPQPHAHNCRGYYWLLQHPARRDIGDRDFDPIDHMPVCDRSQHLHVGLSISDKLSGKLSAKPSAELSGSDELSGKLSDELSGSGKLSGQAE